MPEKNGKSGLEAEKTAWESYLRRAQGAPAAAPEKKAGISESLRSLLAKLRFWEKKEKPAQAEAVPAQGAEEIGFAEEKPAPAAETDEEKAIEQIIKSMQKRRADGEKPVEIVEVPEIGAKPSERIENALSELQHMAAARKAPIETIAAPAEEKAVEAEKPIEWEKPAVEAKALMLPKMKIGAVEKPAAIGKPVVGKAPAKPGIAVQVKAKPGEKIAAKPGAKLPVTPAEKAAAAKIPAKAVKKIEIMPQLKKAPAKKITLMEAAPVVRQAVEYLKVASKTRQWYAQKLQKEKVVLKKKRVKEKVRLKRLVRKAKKRKLSVKEKTVKTRLVKEQKPLLLRIRILEKKIKALQRIGKARKTEEKMLVRSAKEAGVVIPKKELHPPAKGPIRLRTREELAEAVNAMRAVAEEVAAAVIRMPETIPQQPERLSLDSEIDKTSRMAKHLETAFYKRKITVDQFREKLFDYQSKLSELKIKKKLIEQEKKMAAAQGPAPISAVGIHYAAGPGGIGYSGGTQAGAAGGGYAGGAQAAGTGYAARPPPGPIPTAGITPRAARALERIVETAARPEPVRERVVERVIEKPSIGREAAERAPAARPSQAVERAAPAPERAAPAAAERPAIERGQPMPAMEKMLPEKPAAEKAAPAPAVERIVERAPAAKPAAEKVIEREAPAKPVVKKKPGLRLPLRRPFGRAEQAAPAISRDIERVIEKKAAGKLSKPEMDGFSEEVAKLLREYKVPEYQIAAKIEALDSGRLVGDFHKLIGLIKEQEEAKRAEMIPVASGFETATAITPRKKEEIVASEKEIVKAKIETTFDRLLDLVKMRGSIELDETAKLLGLEKKQVKEYAEVLEQSNLLKMVYPPIGQMRLAYPGYLKWKEKQKLEAREKKKEAKK